MLFVEYDKTTKEVLQTTNIKPATSLTSNTKIICVETDNTVWVEEDLGMQDEDGEVLPLPNIQTMPVLLEDLKTMALEYVHHIFQDDNLEFVSGGGIYPCDQETKIYIIGLVASAQLALSTSDSTWSTTRVSTSGVSKSFTATEFIIHSKDMEADLNIAYQTYLQRKASIEASLNTVDIYNIIETL